MSIWCILLAAGSGTRLQAATAGRPKQFLELDGRPLYWHSALTMRGLPEVAGLVFVAPPEHLPAMEEEIRRLWVQDALNLPWHIVPGGARRQDSVRHGLAVLPDDCTRVLVHDSARPFASATLVRRLLEGMDHGAAAVIPAIAVTDTIKETRPDAQDVVLQTLDRNRLRAVQTPQAFALPLLRSAHARAQAEGWEATDDASLMERLGEAVALVPGEERNVKITTPRDLELLAPRGASLLHLLPMAGWGYDVHRYADPHEPKARPMKLGGVPIPKAPLVQAHSDGDVLLHALVDALAALLCAGDIGTRFPDSDPAFENMPSAIFVHELLQDVWGAGIILTHVDLTIIAQVPRVGPYREAIRKHVAQLLKLEPGQVNVKATTEEGLGFTGEKKGIKAVALVSALRPATPPAPGLAPGPGLE